MKPDLFWIQTRKGKLAIAARPRGGDWLADEMPALALEVDVLVSMLRPDEEAELGLGEERALAEKAGIEFVSHPVPDRGLPPDPAAILALARHLDVQLAKGKRVAIHCRMGIGRSALLAAATLAVRGIPVDDAFARVAQARGLDVPDTPEQRRFVETLFGIIECPRCRERGSSFSLREPYINSPEWAEFDATGGLSLRPDGAYECPDCHTRYERRVEEATMFADYDEYYFTKIS